MQNRRGRGQLGETPSWVVDTNATFCQSVGAQCGTFDSTNPPGTFNCGNCPAGKVCMSGRCVDSTSFGFRKVAFQAAQPQMQAGPLKVSGSVTPPYFSNKPLIQTLLVAVTDKVSASSDAPDGAKDMGKIAEWIKAQNWATLVDAYKWAGIYQDQKNLAALCNPALLKNPALAYQYLGKDVCQKRFAEIFNQLVDKCAAEYLKAYQTQVEQALQIDQDQSNAPSAEGETSAWPWILGVGAVVAAAGAAVYFSGKPSTNPAPRTSGYKRLEPALVQALKLARKDREEKYVLPRSDGFRIVRYADLPRKQVKRGFSEMTDREFWVVVPANHYRHWFNNEVVESGAIE